MATKEKSIEEIFDEQYRQIDLMKIDQALSQDYRFDTYAGIKNNYTEFTGKDTMPIGECTKLIEEVHKIHKEIKKRISKFKAEDFGIDDFEDPYADMVPEPREYTDWADVFHDMILFHAIRPWAEIAFNVNNLMTKERKSKDDAKKVMEAIDGGRQK